jgi:hypothetical protein
MTYDSTPARRNRGHLDAVGGAGDQLTRYDRPNRGPVFYAAQKKGQPGIGPRRVYLRLLGTVVAIEAVFLASFILMRQTRMARSAERPDHLNLQIDLISEKKLPRSDS